MQFVFRRDEEGRETISVNDVCVGKMEPERRPGERYVALKHGVRGVTELLINDAIERADEAGFWDWNHLRDDMAFIRNEVTVDVRNHPGPPTPESIVAREGVYAVLVERKADGVFLDTCDIADDARPEVARDCHSVAVLARAHDRVPVNVAVGDRLAIKALAVGDWCVVVAMAPNSPSGKSMLRSMRRCVRAYAEGRLSL